MGIDLLDISFRIEKAFAVRFVGEDWESLLRRRDIAVGDLYGLILKKLNLCDLTRNDIGLNYYLWEKVQATLQQVVGIPAARIELGTPLETLFPKATRRESWNRLREMCPYRVRELDYPKWVANLGFLLAAGVVVIEQFHLWQIPMAKWLWPILGLIGLWMVGEAYLKILKFLAPFRTAFPAKMRTVKDLCRAILGANYREICEEVQIAYDHRTLAVWEQLVQILVEALGVDPDEVTFQSGLIRELGMQ